MIASFGDKLGRVYILSFFFPTHLRPCSGRDPYFASVNQLGKTTSVLKIAGKVNWRESENACYDCMNLINVTIFIPYLISGFPFFLIVTE